ncbi:MAG: 16S rRNA (cytosine(1402)-N(4))-methyltransferase RsmH [Bacteroidales bacterium]|nr:16S rRNA (cytosine(1402)-N(4))-methyltransferase RsmH [Bacteroidales bacterium]
MPRRSPRGKPYHKPTNPNRKRGDERRSTRSGEHVPVMLTEVLTTLAVRPGSVVVDCTLGFAGHSGELLRAVGPTGKLIATDLDAANIQRVEPTLTAVGHPFTLQHSNFAALPTVLAQQGISGVDALLADLGMSSMQVDDPERGFSFLRDGPLDMRMDRNRGRTAADLLNTLPVEELAAAFRDLGDEPAAEAIAAAIVAQREAAPLTRTAELTRLIEQAAPVRILRGPGQPPERKQKLLPATRVFQALRILVNRELANLQQLLRILPDILNPGGTVAIISFHSGEDRLIKASFRDGQLAGHYDTISDEPVRPTEDEKRANPRSRSAKLRWARKCGPKAC